MSPVPPMTTIFIATSRLGLATSSASAIDGRKMSGSGRQDLVRGLESPWICVGSSSKDRGWPSNGAGEQGMRLVFGDCVLDLDRRELSRAGRPVPTGPQVFDLLVYLLKNRDRVVSRDDLLGSVWSGRIVSDSTLASHINAVRKAIGDTGEEQRLLRTVARKGFRFVGEVTEAPEQETAAASPTDSGGTEEAVRRELPIPDGPSIAALPFANLSGDPEQDYFADGLVEDIISALSRIPWLFVVARNS